MGTDLVVYLLFGALIAFAVYRRLRGSFGRQSVRRRAMTFRIVLLSAVGVLLVASLPTPAGIGAAVLGAALGVAFAAIALTRTVYEKSDGAVFYTPDKWIGGAVTALFLGRLAVRLFTAFRMAEAAAASAEPLAGLHRSALTLVFYFLFAGYYVAYYAGVLRRAKSFPAAESTD